MSVRCECGATGEREIAAAGRFGDFVHSLPWWCPVCVERLTFEELARRDAERERERVERRRRALGRREAASSVPRLLRRELGDLEVTEHNRPAITAAKAWMTGELPGLLLVGPVGTGKTAIAGAAVWERELHHTMVWASVPVMVAKALAAFDDERRSEAMRAVTGDMGIALDDIDKVKPSEWASAQLFAAIDSRIVNDESLLVTTNFGLDALAMKFGDYGEAIASRLTGYCRIVFVDGPDRRTRS